MVTGRHDMGPFRTNLAYKNSHAYGDLASMGNCLDCRQYRSMNIRTDERGFVNPPSSGPYDAILMGDSFGLGAEQAEDVNLVSRISQFTGLSIYNACAPMRAISREDLMALIDQLGMTHGTVFFELMDRSLGYAGPPPRERLDRWSENAAYSPLANISGDIVGRLYNVRFMPNPYASNIARKLLPDGQTILFFPEDMQRAQPDRATWWAKYLNVLNKELRQRNFQLIVILVPSKYTVYQPLIKDAIPTDKSEALNELQNKLKDAPVVNTTAALQQAAAAELTHGNLLYWRDDTHWNAEGVRVAAEQLQAEYAAGFPTTPAAAMVKTISQKHQR
jgi:hypothetical protein